MTHTEKWLLLSHVKQNNKQNPLNLIKIAVCRAV